MRKEQTNRIQLTDLQLQKWTKDRIETLTVEASNLLAQKDSMTPKERELNHKKYTEIRHEMARLFYAEKGFKEPNSRSDAVIRGGSWGHSPKWIGSARRNHISPRFRDFGIGFRLIFQRGASK